MRLLDELGRADENEQRRDYDPAGGGHQGLLQTLPVRGDAPRTVHEPRIPVPAPASVRIEPQIFLEALMGARPRPVGQIGRDRFRSLRDRAEAVAVRAHEALNLVDPSGMDAR